MNLRMVAVHASRADQDMEGAYWLARLCGNAYEVPANELHSSDQIQAGWWVVKAKWFKLEQVSHRGYRLLPDEFNLVVNHIVRIPPVQFDKGGRARGTTARSTSSTYTSLSFLSEVKHNDILSRAYLRLGSGIQHSFGRRIITTVSMSSRQYVVTSIPTSSYVVLPAWLYIGTYI